VFDNHDASRRLDFGKVLFLDPVDCNFDCTHNLGAECAVGNRGFTGFNALEKMLDLHG